MKRGKSMTLSLMEENSLEKVAEELRKTLEIDSDIILNPSYFEEVCEKMQKHFTKLFKIYKTSFEDGVSTLVVEKDRTFKINLCGTRDRMFYELIEQIAFALLLDEEERNQNNKVFYFPRKTTGYENECRRYLMLAIMMPRKVFSTVLTKYQTADGGAVDILKMNLEVNKYCNERASTLHFW